MDCFSVLLITGKATSTIHAKVSIRIYIPNLPRQQAKTIVGPTLFALLFSGIIVLHFWWLDLKNHFFLFFMVVVLSNGRINLFPFTFFFFLKQSFPKFLFSVFQMTCISMVQITWPCSRTLVTFIGILLLAFAITHSATHTALQQSLPSCTDQ